MSQKLLLKPIAVLACLLCSLGAIAAEAYANYTSSNRTLTFYYDNLRSSRTGKIYDMNAGSNYPGWYNDGNYANVLQAVFDPTFANARPTSTKGWFFQMNSLQSITGMNYLNTEDVTDMQGMFLGCINLTSLDLSSFNTGNVTNMYGMFYECRKLTSLDLRGFNTEKVTDMRYMFNRC